MKNAHIYEHLNYCAKKYFQTNTGEMVISGGMFQYFWFYHEFNGMSNNIYFARISLRPLCLLCVHCG
jgi:hypothetical protein